MGTIYTVYIDKLAYEFETLVATLVSGIQVPPAGKRSIETQFWGFLNLSCKFYVSGGPQVNFSLGANDRQAIQPPVSCTVPVTQKCIAVLFQQLGKKSKIC